MKSKYLTKTNKKDINEYHWYQVRCFELPDNENNVDGQDQRSGSESIQGRNFQVLGPETLSP